MKTMLCVLAACGLTLAACGKPTVESKDDKTAVIHGANGDVTMTGAAPKNLPAYAPLYPGAKVDSSVVTDASTGSGGIVSFTVGAPPAAVIDFYKKAAAKSQLTSSLGVPAEANGSQVLLLSQPGTKRSLSVSVEPAEGQAGTKVGLSYGAP